MRFSPKLKNREWKRSFPRRKAAKSSVGTKPSHPRPIGWDELAATIGARYDIAAESDTLKRHPERFEALRNGYSYREEYF